MFVVLLVGAGSKRHVKPGQRQIPNVRRAMCGIEDKSDLRGIRSAAKHRHPPVPRQDESIEDVRLVFSRIILQQLSLAGKNPRPMSAEHLGCAPRKSHISGCGFMVHAEPVDVLTVKAPFHETRGLGLADLLRLCRRPGHRLQKTLREIVVVAVIVLKTISAQRTELMRRRIDLPVEEQPTRLHERVLRIDLRIVQSLPPAHPRADRGVHPARRLRHPQVCPHAAVKRRHHLPDVPPHQERRIQVVAHDSQTRICQVRKGEIGLLGADLADGHRHRARKLASAVSGERRLECIRILRRSEEEKTNAVRQRQFKRRILANPAIAVFALMLGLLK